MEAGQHQLELNLGDIPSGIYLVSMNTSDQRIQKMLVIQ